MVGLHLGYVEKLFDRKILPISSNISSGEKNPGVMAASAFSGADNNVGVRDG